VSDTTTHRGESPRKESDMDFSTITHGCLPVGTETPHGVIEAVSFTAYQMADGAWVPFATVHGPYKPVAGLVTFSDGTFYGGSK
jgi:hypothetical protein